MSERACYHCGHADGDHQNTVGCPYCRCLATAAEARTDPSGIYRDQPALSPGAQPYHAWQRRDYVQPDVTGPEPGPEPEPDVHADCRARLSRAWGAYLDLLIDTGLLEEVLEHNPHLRRQLKEALR